MKLVKFACDSTLQEMLLVTESWKKMGWNAKVLEKIEQLHRSVFALQMIFIKSDFSFNIQNKHLYISSPFLRV